MNDFELTYRNGDEVGASLQSAADAINASGMRFRHVVLGADSSSDKVVPKCGICDWRGAPAPLGVATGHAATHAYENHRPPDGRCDYCVFTVDSPHACEVCGQSMPTSGA